MSKLWTPEQLKVLLENLHKTNEQVAALVRAHGPQRTTEAIEKKREAMGIRRGPNRMSTQRRREIAKSYVRSAHVWKPLPGCPIERDRAFSKAVLREWARIHGIGQGRAA